MNNNFNNMDDLFNQLIGNMGGFRSESRRYMINGHWWRQKIRYLPPTGQLPNGKGSEQVQHHQGKGGNKMGSLQLGRNLTENSWRKIGSVIGRNKEIQETAEILSRHCQEQSCSYEDHCVN